MEHSNSLSRLSAEIAEIRSQNRTVRLVLRNTERFGVLHLYFEHGRLMQVQAHKENPSKSFADLATWNYATIRVDELADSVHMPGSSASVGLEQALDSTLRQLESRGAVAPPPNSRHAFSVQTQPYEAGAPWEMPPSYALGGDAPPRNHAVLPTHGEPQAHELFSDMQTLPIASTNPSDYVAEAQWQLLALVVKHVVDQAGTAIDQDAADGLIRQSLAYSAVKRPPLRILELDASGWLAPLPGQRITSYPLAEVADAIATLLTNFESRCASLVGEEDAHRIVVAAARPFSASLAQLGLAIAV